MSGEITESAAGRIRKQEVKWNEQEQPEESFSEETVETEKEEQQLTGEERDMTIGEIYDMHEELAELEKNAVEAEPTEDVREDLQTEEEEYKEELQEVPESDQEEENSVEPEVSYTEDYDQPVEEEAEPYEEAEVTSYETQPVEPVQEEATYEEPVQEEVGDINPYTGREYESNSVRMHPKRIGYVQVYDRANHKWIRYDRMGIPRVSGTQESTSWRGLRTANLSGLKLKLIEKRSASAVNASFLYLFPFFLRITLSIDTSDRKIQSFHIHLR